MNLKTIVISAVICSAFLPVLHAAEADGGQPLAWVKEGVGARPLSLGNAVCADPGDAYSFLANPATVGWLEGSLLGSQLSLLPYGRSLSYVSLLWNTKVWKLGRWTVGASMAGFGIGSQYIEKRAKATEAPDGTMSIGETLFVFPLATSFLERRLAVGFSFKLARQSFDVETASGRAFDAGVGWEFLEGLRAGVSLCDFAGVLESKGGYAGAMPLETRAGLSWQLKTVPVLAAIEFGQRQGQQGRFSLGIESSFVNDRLVVRGGLGRSGPVLGLGYRHPFEKIVMSLDYALASDPLADSLFAEFSHRFSLSLRGGMGGVRKKKEPDRAAKQGEFPAEVSIGAFMVWRSSCVPPGPCPQSDRMDNGQAAGFWRRACIGGSEAQDLSFAAGAWPACPMTADQGEPCATSWIFQEASGDLDATFQAGVPSAKQGTASAGIMLREDPTPSSPFVFVFVRSDKKTGMTARLEKGGPLIERMLAQDAPDQNGLVHLRIFRTGGQAGAGVSFDSKTWSSLQNGIQLKMAGDRYQIGRALEMKAR